MVFIGRIQYKKCIISSAASHAVGIEPQCAIEALQHFQGVKRRLEVLYQHDDITVYDDFAHHPTAIEKTIQGVRQAKAHKRLFAIIECRSYTMRHGAYEKRLPRALAGADEVYLFYTHETQSQMQHIQQELGEKGKLFDNVDAIVEQVQQHAEHGDGILVMSNGGFNGLQQKVVSALKHQ